MFVPAVETERMRGFSFGADGIEVESHADRLGGAAQICGLEGLAIVQVLG